MSVIRSAPLLLVPLLACNKLECPEGAGLANVGDTWEWQHTEAWTEAHGDTTGTWTVSLDEYVLDDAAEVIDLLLTAAGTDVTPGAATTEFTTEVRMQCDASGLWLKSASWDGVITTPVGVYPASLSKDLTTYDLVLPAEVEDGQTWTSEPAGTTNDPENGERPYEDTITYTATAFTALAVPAGTYDGVFVRGESTLEDADGNPIVVEANYVDGIGSVLDTVGELVTYTPVAEE